MTVALVLGGSTGIGAAVVRAMRARGDDVLLADRDADHGRRLVDEPAPGRGAFVEVDLAAPDAPADAVDAALEFGGGRLDTLFYNAGVLEAHPLADWTPERFDTSVAVNLRGPLFAVQAAAPALAASEIARVIVTSSTGALRGHAGMPAYHATKAGLLGLVRSLADELGPLGVTVNAVCPGWIDTPFNDGYWNHQADPVESLAALERSIPLRRQGSAEDVVGTVLFLASAASAYLTGQSVVVDGGYTAV